jgi:cobalt/nickel transport system permease protein
MSDALLSPAVGGTMWAAAGAILAASARSLKNQVDSNVVPLMGVLAAFVFAGQMINFAIPGTGSSGHLGGGIILAALLGPPAAFIAMASILTVQALFFADGGLLALGSNMFNLGFLPAYVAYPLLFRPILGDGASTGRITAASVAAAVVGLQLGALAVVLQTTASGIAELPLRPFALLVLPIHLAIGLVEGLITAAVVSFVWKARPEALAHKAERSVSGRPLGTVLAGLAAAAIVTGGLLSWFASSLPDGLEWSIEKAAGNREVTSPADGAHKAAKDIQERTVLLPDYDLPGTGAHENGGAEKRESVASPGTSLSGLVGGLMVLLFAGIIGLLARGRTPATPSGEKDR